MKTDVKQKRQTLQQIIDNAQQGGGGGTGDAYTKAEADAKFQAKADMADYVQQQAGGYITVNGIRLYISSTEPTGNIPDGSVGLGW